MTDDVRPIYALEYLTEQGEVMVLDLHGDGSHFKFTPERSIDFVKPNPSTIAISVRVSGSDGAVWYRTIGDIQDQTGQNRPAYTAIPELMEDGALALYEIIHQYSVANAKDTTNTTSKEST